MAERVFMKGTEAIAEAAVRAGCRFFAGYPITPQNEIPEYMARRLPEVGGTFVQGESEVASVNMLYGAASTGIRAMSSSSSCGISLYSEGVSYCASARIPMVYVNVQRGGPGIGAIQPAQQDYMQATKASGNGGFRMIVLAPDSVQECVDMVYEAYDLAERDQNPVLVLTDGVMGTMMEPVVLPPMKSDEELAECRAKFMPRAIVGHPLGQQAYCRPGSVGDGQEQANIEAAAAAERKTIAANAEAEVAKIAAEAEAYAITAKAEAEAEANRKIAASLTDELIAYTEINQWDGQLPTYMAGGDATTVPVLDLSKE